MRDLVKIEVKGVNFGDLIDRVQGAGVTLDARRIDDTTFLFETQRVNLPILFDILQKKCYTYKVIDLRAKRRNFWLGVGIGVAIVALAMIILVQFCFGVEVTASEQKVQAEVEAFLWSEGCVGSRWSEIDCAALERKILQNVDGVSMASVTKKGMCLIVNTSPAVEPIEPNVPSVTAGGIFADKDGVVSRIFVVSGTALVKPGDTVSLGDLLVAPYTLDTEGNQVPAEVRADVYLFSWTSATVEFRENAVEYERTGAFVTSQIVRYRDKILSQTDVVIPYAHYETETSTRVLGGALPVRVDTIYYYETAPVEVKKDFEAERDALIFEAKQMVLSEIPETDILEEKHTINQVDDVYYVTYYIKRESKV